MTTSPFNRIERLIADKRATYFSAGLASRQGYEYFCTIWARPSSDTLACGHGNTLDEAAHDALSQVDAPAAVPELPGFMTR